jgi:hypothetical protein
VILDSGGVALFGNVAVLVTTDSYISGHQLLCCVVVVHPLLLPLCLRYFSCPARTQGAV